MKDLLKEPPRVSHRTAKGLVKDSPTNPVSLLYIVVHSWYHTVLAQSNGSITFFPSYITTPIGCA